MLVSVNCHLLSFWPVAKYLVGTDTSTPHSDPSPVSAVFAFILKMKKLDIERSRHFFKVMWIGNGDTWHAV